MKLLIYSQNYDDGIAWILCQNRLFPVYKRPTPDTRAVMSHTYEGMLHKDEGRCNEEQIWMKVVNNLENWLNIITIQDQISVNLNRIYL